MANIVEGRCRAKVSDHGLSESKSGTAQYRVQFECLDGENKGEHISWYGGLEGGGAQYTIRDLRTMGWVGDDIEKVDLTNEVQIKIVEDTYNGKTSMKVKYIDPIGGAVAKPIAEDKRRSIASRVKALVASGVGTGPMVPPPRAAPAPRQAPPPVAESFPVDEADIPF